MRPIHVPPDIVGLCIGRSGRSSVIVRASLTTSAPAWCRLHGTSPLRTSAAGSSTPATARSTSRPIARRDGYYSPSPQAHRHRGGGPLAEICTRLLIQ